MGLLSWLSGQTGERFGPSLPGPSGNILHMPAFAVLAFFVLRAQVPLDGWWSPASWPGLRSPPGWRTLGIVIAFACIDETHQFFVPGRTCSVLDIVVDGLGAVAVLTWPVRGAAGRPQGWMPLVLAVLSAVGIALLGYFDRILGDRALEDLLVLLGGSPG
jgi:hypothetical protein